MPLLKKSDVAKLSYGQFFASFRSQPYLQQLALQREAGFSIAYDDWKILKRAQAIVLGLPEDASTEMVIYYALGGKQALSGIGKPSIRLEFPSNDDLLDFAKTRGIVVDGGRQELPQPKPEPKAANFNTGIELVPLSEITTDHKNFQNRDAEFSIDSVVRIVNSVNDGSFRWSLFDPITLWVSPEGNKVVLSGHSRTEAFRRLASMGAMVDDRDFESIPAKLEFTDLEMAKALAKTSNNLSTKETDVERAAYYRAKFQAGASLKEVMAEAKKFEGRNAIFVVNLACLADRGHALQNLKALEGGNEGQNLQIIKTIADWVGNARRVHTELTDSHENELSDWLHQVYGKAVKNRNEFMQRVSALVSKAALYNELHLPLNPMNRASKTEFEQDYDQELKTLKSEIAAAVKDLNESRKRGQGMNYSNDYLSKLLEPKEDLVRALQRKYIEAEKRITNVKEGARAQLSIFGPDPNYRRLIAALVEGKSDFADDLDKLKAKEQAYLLSKIEMYEAMENLQHPHFKSLSGAYSHFSEFRPGDFRIIVVKINAKDFVMLSIFRKKSMATDPKELRKADRRLREYLASLKD